MQTANEKKTQKMIRIRSLLNNFQTKIQFSFHLKLLNYYSNLNINMYKNNTQLYLWVLEQILENKFIFVSLFMPS